MAPSVIRRNKETLNKKREEKSQGPYHTQDPQSTMYKTTNESFSRAQTAN